MGTPQDPNTAADPSGVANANQAGAEMESKNESPLLKPLQDAALVGEETGKGKGKGNKGKKGAPPPPTSGPKGKGKEKGKEKRKGEEETEVEGKAEAEPPRPEKDAWIGVNKAKTAKVHWKRLIDGNFPIEGTFAEHCRLGRCEFEINEQKLREAFVLGDSGDKAEAAKAVAKPPDAK